VLLLLLALNSRELTRASWPHFQVTITAPMDVGTIELLIQKLDLVATAKNIYRSFHMYLFLLAYFATPGSEWVDTSPLSLQIQLSVAALKIHLAVFP
jgi:hypothetical protein